MDKIQVDNASTPLYEITKGLFPPPRVLAHYLALHFAFINLRAAGDWSKRWEDPAASGGVVFYDSEKSSETKKILSSKAENHKNKKIARQKKGQDEAVVTNNVQLRDGRKIRKDTCVLL